MRLSRLELKILFETLILKEGQVEDLLAKEPDLQAAINLGIKNPGQLRWLVRMKKFEPIADMVGLIRAFEQNKQRLEIKDLDVYRNPNDLRSALEALGESEGEQRRQLKKSETDIVYEDETWLVVMPHTMESSIQWGKGTTWCTAATQSANLFYSYAGRKKEDIILYYIIRKGADSKLDPNAKLSVGFIDGTPFFSSEHGGLTVNASNNGLTESSLKKILDTKLDLIMSAMKSHSKKIKSKHPAKKAMQKIAQSKNPSVLEKYTAGMNYEERIDFITTLLDYDLSVQMLTFFVSDIDTRELVAKNINTPPEVLTSLVDFDDSDVRISVAENPNTPPEALTILAFDESENVKFSVTNNPNTPLEALISLASDPDRIVRIGVARNFNTPAKTLALLARDEDIDLKISVAENPNTPSEALTILAFDESENVREVLAKNPNTPPEDLSLLAKDEDAYVRFGLTLNPSAPLEVLTLLSRDKVEDIRANVVYNPNVPYEVLARLASDKANNVRMHLAYSRRAPPEVLTILASDENEKVREGSAFNSNTPLEVLNSLAADESEKVRRSVAKNPTYQKYLESQKKLAERWSKLAGLNKRKLV